MPEQVTIFTTSDVAAAYGVDSSTIRRWVAAGTLTPLLETRGGHFRFDATALPAAERTA